MLGRTHARAAAGQAVDTLRPYADRLVHDDTLRRRLGDAVGHGAAAGRRVGSQVGAAAAVLRLSQDEELLRHVRKLTSSLDEARGRLRRKRSHRLRNTLLVLAGGAVATAALVPFRARLLGLAGLGRDDADGGRLTTIEESIEVGVPVAKAYNQWTQFEQFPLFMDGVEDVRQLDDTRLHWVASVGGKQAEWDARILEQQPDTRIVWESTDGHRTRGTVSFDKTGEDRSRIRLAMAYRPEGPVEAVGSAVGLDARRVRGDLERFKELVESPGAETGAWRGEIESGSTTT